MAELSNAEINEQAKDRFQRLVDDVYTKARAYFMHFEANERKYSLQTKRQLKEKYGKEIYAPEIRWKREFEFLGPHFEEVVDRLSAEYLAAIPYHEQSYLLPRDRLKNYLWNKARADAHGILDQLNEQTL